MAENRDTFKGKHNPTTEASTRSLLGTGSGVLQHTLHRKVPQKLALDMAPVAKFHLPWRPSGLLPLRAGTCVPGTLPRGSTFCRSLPRHHPHRGLASLDPQLKQNPALALPSRRACEPLPPWSADPTEKHAPTAPPPPRTLPGPQTKPGKQLLEWLSRTSLF